MPIPEQIDLFYADGTPPLRCASPSELAEVLEAMHRRVDPEYPICVVVAIPRHSLCLGLGSDPTFAIVHVEPYDGEYYTTVGNAQAVGSRDYYGCGGRTPYGMRSMIPWADALPAVLEFVANQRRDGRVSWENANQVPCAVDQE